MSLSDDVLDKFNALKKAHKSKTCWLAMAIAVLSVIEQNGDILPVDPANRALVGYAVSMAIVVLRLYTTGALNDK